MTSDFMAMANGITSNLLTLIDALQGTTFRNERQLKGFHHFFFMSVTSTSTDMYRPLPILPHAVGTHWLLRVLRQAIYKKGARNDDRLLANVDSNSVIFGISYEVILLRQIKDGSLRHSYNIPGHSGLKLPHVADGAVGFDHPYPEVYLDRNATLPTLQGSSHFFVTLGPNFPTVDAVIITPAHVQLLQVTIATRHNLHQSGLNRVYQLIKHNDMLQGRQWHFVFLAPKKEIADTLCSSAPAQKLLRFARDKLHLDMHLGSMAVPLAHPVSSVEAPQGLADGVDSLQWTDHPNEVFTEPMELPELPIEESDVDMDP